MIRIRLNLKNHIPYTRQSAIRVAECASHFDASATLTDSRATINLKSVIGLLSMAITGREEAVLECIGTDESEAAQAIRAALLEEA